MNSQAGAAFGSVLIWFISHLVAIYIVMGSAFFIGRGSVIPIGITTQWMAKGNPVARPENVSIRNPPVYHYESPPLVNVFLQSSIVDYCFRSVNSVSDSYVGDWLRVIWQQRSTSNPIMGVSRSVEKLKRFISLEHGDSQIAAHILSRGFTSIYELAVERNSGIIEECRVGKCLLKPSPLVSSHLILDGSDAVLGRVGLLLRERQLLSSIKFGYSLVRVFGPPFQFGEQEVDPFLQGIAGA